MLKFRLSGQLTLKTFFPCSFNSGFFCWLKVALHSWVPASKLLNFLMGVLKFITVFEVMLLLLLVVLVVEEEEVKSVISYLFST